MTPTQMTSNEEKIDWTETREGKRLSTAMGIYLAREDFDKQIKSWEHIKGLVDNLLHSQKERVVEMCKEMEKDMKSGTFLLRLLNAPYNKALSDLKTKIEEL